jgi:hypothetical protein
VIPARSKAMLFQLLVLIGLGMAKSTIAHASQCDWQDYLSYLFSQDKPFNRAAYVKKVEHFERAISSKKLNGLDKLTAMDQIALIEAFTKSNHVNPLNLAEILERNPVFRKKIEKIGKKIKTKNGYRLSNLNHVFDEIYTATNPQFDAILSKKWKGKDKQLIDQWINQELGKRNMESVAKSLGILKDETAFEAFKLWKQRHRNGIKISVNTAANGPMIYYLKTLGNLPNIKLFKVNEKLFEKIEKEGLESIKPELYAHYRNSAISQLIYNNIKKNYGRAFKALAAYYIYQNWNEIKKQSNLYYNMASTAIGNLLIDEEDLQDQINKTFSLEAAQEEEIINTMQAISDESNGNLRPEDIWNQVKAHLELTNEDLKPNITNPDQKLSDQKNKVSEHDVETVSLKILREMKHKKMIKPSVIIEYVKWIHHQKTK